MDFIETTAELIITGCKKCSEITSKGEREKERELKGEKNSEKKITTFAFLVINTSVLAILRFVQRQVAENRQYCREMMRGKDEELLCSKLYKLQK